VGGTTRQRGGCRYVARRTAARAPAPPSPLRCSTPALAGGRNDFLAGAFDRPHQEENAMNAIIYLVGLVVVIMFILSVLGLR
jgi:hypothetical protein